MARIDSVRYDSIRLRTLTWNFLTIRKMRTRGIEIYALNLCPFALYFLGPIFRFSSFP